ncbi:Uncharacterised protein [Porphyromonas crevioricanis]|uniref:Uncharacterized protein n=2 Tax=Porphyromonas crevioricanis TaxID=393921 RepID=A0A2X4PVZ6_9PORP|nr:Uncharacterised protein [Porphyromonas crevioricanis]
MVQTFLSTVMYNRYKTLFLFLLLYSLCSLSLSANSRDLYLSSPVGESDEIQGADLSMDGTDRMDKIRYALGTHIAVWGGVGIEGAVGFTPKLTARLGYNFFSWSVSRDKSLSSFGLPKDVSNSVQESLGYDPQAALKGSVLSSMGYALVDYHPFSSFRMFHVSAGAYFGKISVSAKALLNNPTSGKSIVYDWDSPDDLPQSSFKDTDGNQCTIRPTDEGELHLTSIFGNAIKPYVGVGLGYSAPDSGRVSFRLGVGVLYSGMLRFESPNVVEGDVNKLVLVEQDYVPTVVQWTQWLPSLSLGLSVRIL